MLTVKELNLRISRWRLPLACIVHGVRLASLQFATVIPTVPVPELSRAQRPTSTRMGPPTIRNCQHGVAEKRPSRGREHPFRGLHRIVTWPTPRVCTPAGTTGLPRAGVSRPGEPAG